MRTASGLLFHALAMGVVFTCWSTPYAENSALQETERRSASLALKDWSGVPRTLQDYSGKVVLVNFWASWCAPCLQEIPDLLKLAEQFADAPFSILAVNVEEPRKRIEWLVNYVSPRLTVLLDSRRQAFAAWEAEVLPTSFILDHRGRIRYVVQGPFDWNGAQAQSAIRALLDEGGYSPETVGHSEPEGG